tara:strand:+ start:2114 stop:2800 length:687 start_codon:yes stop_codon:yes gene_type:complete
MIGSFKFDGGIQKILLVAVILIVGGYLYIEIRKLSHEVQRLKQSINRESNKYKDIEDPSFSKKGPTLIVEKEPSSMEPEIIRQVPEQTVRQEFQLSGLQSLQSLQSLMESSEIEEQSSMIKVEELDESERESSHTIDSMNLNDSPGRTLEPSVSDDTPEIIPPQEEAYQEEAYQDDIKIITQDQDPYRDKTVSELKAILQEKGLPLSGNKTKLINRIKEHVTVEKQQD